MQNNPTPNQVHVMEDDPTPGFSGDFTGWTVQAISNFDEVPATIHDRAIPAQVPGCVHLDLLNAGLIPDPYLDRNEELVQWIGRTDWEFRATFTVDEAVLAHDRVDLAADGLDTVATIFINGTEVGRSANMHVRHRFPVKAALRDGENEIRIIFASAALYARAIRDQLGDLPTTYPDHEPYNFIRKNACNFGWDWGPVLITAGIWQEIRLEAWSGVRFKSVRPLVKQANLKFAVVEVECELEFASTSPDSDEELPLATVFAYLNEGENFDDTEYSVFGSAEANADDPSVSITLTVKNPDLWWPQGYGEQPLYGLVAAIVSFDPSEGDDPGHEHDDECEEGCHHGEPLDAFQTLIGLREVELDTTPDEVGQAWTIKINGQPIWIKGANWIPDDVFLTRASEPARLDQRISQAVDANMNMLRVWGGGIYESDAFYSICDRLGVLVWQDFLFGCAAYAEEEPLRSEVIAEARDNVARLCPHPSLVLWNGCNENIWGWFDWGWPDLVGSRTWGLGYYLKVLPEIVAELDPTRPYWPGSPYSGSMDIHPLADQFGPKHIWDCWNEADYTKFRAYSPRFASEFGHQAPPTFATLAASIPEDQRDPYSAAMLSHQKAERGNIKLHKRLLEHFAMPTEFDDWIYLTQLNQARAMTTAVEWFRTRSVCTGALYWQLNDCWPVTSWAAIDGYGREKPLYFATQRFFAPRLLTIQPDGDALAVWAHNDSAELWSGEVTVTLVDLNGQPQHEATYFLKAQPRELVKLARLGTEWTPFDPSHAALTALVAGAERTFWFFQPDKELKYSTPRFAAKYEDGTLTVTAETLIRDLRLFADRLGATTNGGLFTLLPGESAEFGVESSGELNLAELTAPPVLQCANWFRARA